MPIAPATAIAGRLALGATTIAGGELRLNNGDAMMPALVAGTGLGSERGSRRRGVFGKIERRAIGSFSYEKRLKSGKMVVCDVKVFPLKVERQEERWPEKGERQLKWLSRTKAAKTVEDSGLGTLIRSLPKVQ